MVDGDLADWERCASWLARCRVLSAEMLDNLQEVQDLVQNLRDGVILCRLLNELRPGTIESKNFSQRPQTSQFLYLKNVRAFLQSCEKSFGIKRSDLFDAPDLVEAKNFNSVIHTLSVLSRTKEVTKSGIDPFVAEQDEIYNISSIGDIESDQIYKNLDDSFDDDYEEVYGMLIEMPSSPPVPRSETLSKRDRCVNELIDTEKNYIDVLLLIIEKFMRPLESHMSAVDFSSIFRHFEPLRKTHDGLYQDLVSSRKPPGSGSSLSVAKCFTKWKLKMVIYGAYCSDMIQAQELLEKLCKNNKQFGSFIADLNTKANDNRFRLVELLTIPMQRVLKYHLLLKELIKNTDENHPERSELNVALEDMQDLSLYVNEVKRDNENLELIDQIEQGVVNIKKFMPVNTHLNQYGKHLYDGELKMKGPLDQTYAVRYIFLFDKLLLACKPKGDKYSYKDCLVMKQHRLSTEDHSFRDKQAQHTFVLKEDLPDTENPKSYIFAAKSADLVLRWKEFIDLAINSVCPEGYLTAQHKFRLVTFVEPTTCCVCNKLLRGVFFQGYQCQRTNKCVHKECIAKINGALTERKPAMPPPTANQRAAAPLPQRPAAQQPPPKKKKVPTATLR